MLLRHLPNFKAIWAFHHMISCLQDFARSYDKIFIWYWIGPQIAPSKLIMQWNVIAASKHPFSIIVFLLQLFHLCSDDIFITWFICWVVCHYEILLLWVRDNLCHFGLWFGSCWDIPLKLILLTHLPPSAAYMRRWTGSALVQVMAWRRTGDKPLPEPMLIYY